MKINTQAKAAVTLINSTKYFKLVQLVVDIYSNKSIIFPQYLTGLKVTALLLKH